ncbi:hypothetical protein [Phytomonospora endophytica]|uniref:Uncharacterized protein n=1 Tax=Phytomonospora endophytica TaxID=714109 RepID=A0A841FRT2_9ACTN|nr:hypothetical protein [Phytomonospora endophytica]MBB6034670.1 hypothetical protein [Phytomonospora endophytica]GIG69129.1 hypothetical protein Pen01_54240 [Phytomonospora endophytica]
MGFKKTRDRSTGVPTRTRRPGTHLGTRLNTLIGATAFRLAVVGLEKTPRTPETPGD